MTEHATNESLGLSSLFRGVFGDVRALVRQEIRLAKAELLKEWGKAKTAAEEMAAGAAILGVGALLLCLAGASALHEAAGLPWWASFLALGGAFTLVGAGLLYAGRRKAAQVHVIPPHGAAAEPTDQPGADKGEPPSSDTGAARQSAAEMVGRGLGIGEETGGTPWGLLGMALAAGVALEALLGRRSARGEAKPPAAAPEAAASPPAAPDAEGADQPGFVEMLSGQLGGEFEKLQELAIDAIVALVRNVAQKSIAAMAVMVEEKVSEAAARFAASMPQQAEGRQGEGAGDPTAEGPPAP